MKILVVCQHYWPEPYPLEDVCEELVKRGHQVDVVTGVPNYPMGYVYDGYRNGKNRKQEHNGVRIRRTLTIARRKSRVLRLLNYFSFAISSTLYTLTCREKYDVVFTNQTSPVMMSCAALAYAKKHKIKSVLYCMDLWPTSLAAGGVQQTSVLYKFFKVISGIIYRNADTILISSQSFRDYLREEFQIADDRIVYHPQYAVDQFKNLPEKQAEDQRINLVFAGNIGAAQSLHTIIEAAAILRERQDILFHLVGDGSELENLQKKADELELPNVVFHGRKPLSEMPKYYAMADAMLVTLTEDPLISMTLPGKVQTYMAAGKPILAAANGEIKHTVEKSGCGLVVGAEDHVGLAKMVEQFVDSDWEEFGRRSRAYFDAHYQREKFFFRLEEELKG